MGDFDMERDLEDAGIDAFEFSLMDESERREALDAVGLDPDYYQDANLDSSFDAWSNLQSAGLSLSELEFMDQDERREALKEAGLDPDDYESAPSWTPSANADAPSVTPVPAPVRHESERPRERKPIISSAYSSRVARHSMPTEQRTDLFALAIM